MTTPRLCQLAILVAVLLVQANCSSAQTIAATTPPRLDLLPDSVTVEPNPSSGYIHLSGGLLGLYEGDPVFIGSIGYRYSSAQSHVSSGFGFTASGGLDLLTAGDGLVMALPLINLTIGTEMVNNGYVVGLNTGVMFPVIFPVPIGYAELLVGHEFQAGSSAAFRIQGGAIMLISSEPSFISRLGAGFVFR